LQVGALDEAAIARLVHRGERLCEERGARLTRQRRTVLAILCASERPLSAYEILDRMTTGGRRPAPPTVYRALEFLLDQGLAHRLESLHAFVGCHQPGEPHAGQFLICADCGDVRELENEGVLRSLRSAAEAMDLRPQRPVVEVMGTCAACARRRRGGQ
jgi:Fur family zinc uptake transcriptional regulator